MKNSKTKKLLSVLLCAVMVLGIFGTSGLTLEASAATVTTGITDDGIEYEEVEIIGYSGSATDFVIPETIEGCPVSGISVSNSEGFLNLKSRTIPKTIYYIEDITWNWCTNLTALNVDENSLDFISEN